MTEQELKLEAMRKMYEHEPCLTPEERARHIEVETDRILGKPSPIVREREKVGVCKQIDGLKKGGAA